MSKEVGGLTQMADGRLECWLDIYWRDNMSPVTCSEVGKQLVLVVALLMEDFQD